LGPDNTCHPNCVNLSLVDPAVNGNPRLGIGLILATDNAGQYINADHLSLTGERYCDGTGILQVGNLTESPPGSYKFTVRDVGAVQLGASVECVWGDPAAGYRGNSQIWYQP
jgi:hypothetical protein